MKCSLSLNEALDTRPDTIGATSEESEHQHRSKTQFRWHFGTVTAGHREAPEAVLGDDF